MTPQERLASELVSALWNNSTLRHGLFTPPEFRELCEEVILRRINDPPEGTRPLKRGEAVQIHDHMKNPYHFYMWSEIRESHRGEEVLVGITPHCPENSYLRPIQS